MISEFLDFVLEREAIRIRKESGIPSPWTHDPILATGYFCNVRRNDDKVTRWLRDNWFEPNKDDEDIFFAASVARNINLPATMAEIGYPVPWDPDKFFTVMTERSARGEKSYSGAYMIRAGLTEGDIKARYQRDSMFNPLWERRELIRPRWGDSLAEFHERLRGEMNFGDFMSGQVIADIKPYGVLADAPDWFTWAPRGPGSMRGLNILNNRDLNAKWTQKNFLEEVNALQELINRKLKLSPPLDAHDVQNCLCEASKYFKAKYFGVPVRRKYRHENT